VTYVIGKECIDCGAGEEVCSEVAIFPARRARGNAKWEQFTTDNAEFFTVTLPGRDTPLGAPGGAGGLGPVGADTALVTSWDA